VNRIDTGSNAMFGTEPVNIKARWIGVSGLGALIGASIAMVLFPGAAFAENPTGQFGWHLVGFALSVGVPFAVAQWILLHTTLQQEKAMAGWLSAVWLVFSAAGIGAILLPLWWMPWGQVLLAPYMTVSVMIPGSLVLALGQRFVLGRIGESGADYVWLTCLGVAVGGYLGLIAAFLLSALTGALLPLEHAWALLFGLTVGAFQSRPLARVIGSVAAGRRTD
jgi:hypothetical protein